MRGFFAKIFRGTSAGTGFAQIEEKLKGKAGELGQCLKNIDKVLNSTMPRDEALENELTAITKEIRSLVQAAIARIRDLQNIADFLSGPTEKDKKESEIKTLALGLKKKNELAVQTFQRLKLVIMRLNDFWEGRGPGDGALRPAEKQGQDALDGLNNALHDFKLDKALAKVLKTTSFPGTMSSTVRLLPDDAISIHELIDGKGARIEDSGRDESTASLNQLNSLLNVWRIILTDFNAVAELWKLSDETQVANYQKKLGVVLNIYALYGRSLEAF